MFVYREHFSWGQWLVCFFGSLGAGDDRSTSLLSSSTKKLCRAITDLANDERWEIPDHGPGSPPLLQAQRERAEMEVEVAVRERELNRGKERRDEENELKIGLGRRPRRLRPRLRDNPAKTLSTSPSALSRMSVTKILFVTFLLLSDQELTVQERNLLSVAYKNFIGARRAFWRKSPPTPSTGRWRLSRRLPTLSSSSSPDAPHLPWSFPQLQVLHLLLRNL
ncbi:hypothetical protein K438DRAFT_1990126 [Mycena galopus ATCC 62051]|nr:hypothetical protein K438DRAFT_1990126 [Mycena galopus ATCC 62051]